MESQVEPESIFDSLTSPHLCRREREVKSSLAAPWNPLVKLDLSKLQEFLAPKKRTYSKNESEMKDAGAARVRVEEFTAGT